VRVLRPHLVSRSFSLLALFVFLDRSVLAQTANPDGVYAIRGAKIWIGDGRTIEKGTILIRRGVVEAIGESVEIPFDAETIDAEGLEAAPAFLDAFATLGVKAPEGPSPNEAPLVDTSVTAEVEMPEANRAGLRPEFAAADVFALDEAGGKAHREAGFAAAVVGPAGGILAGQTALVALSGEPRREAIFSESVYLSGAFAPAGAGYPGTEMGVFAHLRQAFHDASLWRDTIDRYERNGRAGPRPPHDDTLAVLADVLEKKIPVALEADSARVILRALSFAKEFGIRLWILGGAEAWKVTDALHAEGVPVILGLDFGEEPKRRGVRAGRAGEAAAKPEGEGKKEEEEKPAPGEEKPAGEEEKKEGEKKEPEKAAAGAEGEIDDPEPLRVFEDRKKKWEEKVACAARLHEAGVQFAFTTQGTRSPSEFLKNLEKAIERGLPREAAIAALTAGAARLLGFADRLGVLEPEGIANVAIWNGAPGTKGAKVRFLFADGKKFEFEAKGKDKKDSKEGAAPPAPGIDLSGAWEVQIEGGGRTRTVSLRLTQEGGSLVGTWESEMGSADTEGTLSGKEIELSVQMSFGDREFTIGLVGTVEGNDTMKGTMTGRFGSGSQWTAKRKGPGLSFGEVR
jgi:imidazolonepropionase-like amidohydrolase